MNCIVCGHTIEPGHLARWTGEHLTHPLCCEGDKPRKPCPTKTCCEDLACRVDALERRLSILSGNYCDGGAIDHGNGGCVVNADPECEPKPECCHVPKHCHSPYSPCVITVCCKCGKRLDLP